MILAILTFSICCLVHSLTATFSFKKIIQEKIISGKSYRLIYNIFSILTFGFWYHFFITKANQNSVYALSGALENVFNTIRAIGLLGFLLTLRDFSGIEFLGFREQNLASFTTKGMFKLCRHPLYFFSILILLFDTNPNPNKLVFNLGCTIYFLIGSYFEEQRMIKELGEKYLEYQKNTPRLIPFLKRT